ncbi:uncharacterized protein LOC132162621 isoform X3 [Corylus avellana]|uniref:uncharacterized protein LOC132162621 isoform X3 n=1 Tax=Corylus avellana TaxID=13451 RepID=UPI00286CA6F4|nr:uncharacterized protein LOC132162621 isoform X3 [Corylus avellana]
MSRRKLQKSIWREGHRRSPRISQKITASTSSARTSGRALATTRAQETGNGQGATFQTRTTKKRKIRPAQEVAATSLSTRLQKGGRKPNYEDQDTKNVQPVVERSEDSPRHEYHAPKTSLPFGVPSAPWMPEKRVLQLILDILQRRDTHEIFAEPVDPNEVEDYYEIIEEPMDFGTMRAKLHEGMYQSLEQFEHDVLLIPKNAMHFNSSATIYFRQARAIHELAQKIFHILKTDPENFELEFSETRRRRRRRRNGRRHQVEARGSIKSSCPKLPTNEKSSSMTTDISSKTMPSFGNSLNLRRSFQLCSQYSGVEDGRRFRSFGADRRCTYKPWMSFLNENESNFSTIYGTLKPLEHVNQQDIGYRESLMLFVKDLGSTAQMIAEQKLVGLSAEASKYQTSNYWFQAQKCHTDMESNSAKLGPSTLNTIITAHKPQNFLDHPYGQPSVVRKSCDRLNLVDADKGKDANVGDKLGIPGDAVEVTPYSNLKNALGAFNGEVHASDEEKNLGVFGNDKIIEDRSYEVQLGSYSFTAGTGDLDCLVAKFQNTGRKPTTLESNEGNSDQPAQLELPSKCSNSNVSDSPLKNSHSSPTSWSLRNMGENGMSSFSQAKGSMQKSSLEYPTAHDQVIAAGGPSYGVCSSSEAGGQTLKSDQQASQFIFDLPYLRTRLDQMSCWTRTQPRSDDQQRSSLDTHHLALQL